MDYGLTLEGKFEKHEDLLIISVISRNILFSLEVDISIILFCVSCGCQNFQEGA